MGFYQSKYDCKDCGDPVWYDDDIRSQKTGGRIPLNSDHEKHYTTCPSRPQKYGGSGQSLQQQPQRPQQQQQQVQPPTQQQVTPLSGPLQLESEILARLDRIDVSVKKMADAMATLAKFYRDNEEARQAEDAYTQDKEDGLV